MALLSLLVFSALALSHELHATSGHGLALALLLMGIALLGAVLWTRVIVRAVRRGMTRSSWVGAVIGAALVGVPAFLFMAIMMAMGLGTGSD